MRQALKARAWGQVIFRRGVSAITGIRSGWFQEYALAGAARLRFGSTIEPAKPGLYILQPNPAKIIA
jgi:hypothetical protein